MSNTETQTAQGVAITENASKYLQQLCKHWSHKADTSFDPTDGHIRFENGNRLELTADSERLTLSVMVPASGDLEHFKDVVDRHLKRFAFREELEIAWEN